MTDLPFGAEVRLLWALLLNGGTFACAYRFVRRWGGGGGGGSAAQTACDAFLATFLVEYVSVGLPGLFGFFNPFSMSAVALLSCGLLAWGAPRGAPALRSPGPPAPPPRPAAAWERVVVLACVLFVVGFLAAYVYVRQIMPPTATDSLVYHLPTAVQWLQTGRLGVYPTWYWNPAASYCPLSGSMYMAWLMAPTGDDVLARFVQIAPLLFLFAIVLRLCQDFGCGPAAAALVALAAVIARPFLNEAMITKDDLFVTAFVGAAVLALAPGALRDRLGPWRLGAAAGLVLACKYTVLLACPVFVFLADAPPRAGWRWRDYGVAAAVALPLAAPWYLRNVLWFHDPLYPVDVRLFGVRWFTGLFGTAPDQQLRSMVGVARMLFTTYDMLPPAVAVLLLAAWAAALVKGRTVLLRDPLPRACVVGSALVFLLFLGTSPHHEVRYMFPLLLLWFAGGGLAIALCLRRPAARCAAAGLLAVAAAATCFAPAIMDTAVPLILTGLALAACGAPLILLRPPPRLVLAGAAAASLVGLGVIYVYWNACVEQYRELVPAFWTAHYGPPAPAWQFVREQLPPDATVAYANTYFTYPLYGFRWQRKVVYAPTRRGLHDFLHFPRMGDAVPGDLIVQTMTRLMDSDPDRATWLGNLRASGAQYLLVVKHALGGNGLDPDPPELTFARSRAARFVPVFEDADSVVYRVVW